MTKVKICGLSTPEAVATAVEAGADYIGFVFAKSKRQVSLEQAHELAKGVTGQTKIVGVFVSPSLEELEELEEILEASRIPMEQRDAVRKMGSRFVKTIEKHDLEINETGIYKEYVTARKGKNISHSCVYGVFCSALGIELEEALEHYLYAQTSAMVTNCVKTIPLSQSEGLKLLS